MLEEGGREAALRLLDEIDNLIDGLLASMAPERITDERFEAASKAVRELSAAVNEVRRLVYEGRLRAAAERLPDLQRAVREAHRLLLFVRSGAPTPLLFQVTPEFLRAASLRPPETIVLLGPMAVKLYNAVVRRGEVPVEELARELGVTDETREEFNRAVTQLVSLGYVTVAVTPDNRIVLRAVR